MTRYDLVIAGTTVIEGTARAVPYVADIGVIDGRIAEVGDLSRHQRRETVDATGRATAPGFIDTHTHAEMAALRGDPDRCNTVRQGITTTLVGADGFGWVGLGDTDRRRRWRDTAAIYGDLIDPLPVWEKPHDFLADLRAASPTRVVPLAPHGNIRAAVMGDDPAPAGSHAMAAMRELLDAWLDAGAVGMASGLDYLPGRYAGTDEIVELCERVAAWGGVYASHLRLQDAGRAGAWREIGDIGRRAGVPVRIAHERLDDEGAALLSEIAGGNDVTFDTYLYPAGCTSLVFHVPAEHLRQGVDVLAERVRTDTGLARDLADLLDARIGGHTGQSALIAATTSGAHEGRTLAELAGERGTSVGEVAVDLMKTELPCALLVYVWQSADATWDAIMRRTLEDPHSIIASDGIYVGSHPHPRGFSAFPRVLGELVRDRGIGSLAAAVHKMSGKPADAYGLTDRGRIEPGRAADLVVFTPEQISGPGTYADPRRDPIGIDLVLIGGRPAHRGRNEE